MTSNKNLNRAKEKKDDEFYTLYSTIEKEIPYYVDQLNGKTIYYNCDDPHWSNFFRYFIYSFNKLGLRRLICSCFAGKAIYGIQRDLFREEKQLSVPGKAWCADIHTVMDAELPEDKEELDVNSLLNLPGNSLTELRTGDFRSDECVALLRQADIVITNPPFSLARDFIDLLVREGKDYLFLSSITLSCCRSMINQIKEGKARIGPSIRNNSVSFRNRGGYLFKFSNIVWYTSLSPRFSYPNLIMDSCYNQSKHPHYDNMDAIDVNAINQIPKDYYGLIGVPVTFLYYSYEDKFRIVGTNNFLGDFGVKGRIKLNGLDVFKRIIIQRKQTAP